MKYGKTLSILQMSAVAAGATACTGQLPGSFRLAQQDQTFSSQMQVNTKIDLLWVVDDSSSMDISQNKLRNGFATFAAKYMKPTWDIRVAVITTDTYLANPAFQNYLNQPIPGTSGWKSTYINSRLGTFVNPHSNPTLVNMSTGAFDHGVRYQDLMPAWASNFGRLLPGLHDGPIAALCTELLPYFIKGVTDCPLRDNQAAYSGSSHCLFPDATAGETSLSQCVNTVENDTIHTGHPILSTLGGDPVQLVDDFMINVSTGSAGHGSERGLGSVLQLINDNEMTDTAFFRKDSLRGIIFVSDEDDQTMQVPSQATAPSGYNPWTHYACDQAGLINNNGSTIVTGTNGVCCSTPGNNCRFGSEGTSCPSKTVDGYTYTISFCPLASQLVPVSDVKNQLDTFFSSLDGAGSAPNYFVATITALDGSSIQALHATRLSDDAGVGAIKTIAVDRGDRYISLANLVGNGSLSMSIAVDDYTPILKAIGDSIIAKKSTFVLARVPTGSEDMIVQVNHADGTYTIIDSSNFTINGNVLTITNEDLVLGLASTDTISINYQPKSITDRQ